MWYCPACTRRAARDAEKEFKSLLATMGRAVDGSQLLWDDIKRARVREYWDRFKASPLPVAQKPAVLSDDGDDMDLL